MPSDGLATHHTLTPEKPRVSRAVKTSKSSRASVLSPTRADAELIRLRTSAEQAARQSDAIWKLAEGHPARSAELQAEYDRSLQVWATVRAAISKATAIQFVAPDGLRAKAELAFLEMTEEDLDNYPLTASLLRQIVGRA